MTVAAPGDRDWETTFREWSKPPSDSEDERCANASRMVREALAASPAFSSRKLDVFAHGSYRNSTNVRLGSDVDICVRYSGGFYPDFSWTPGWTGEGLGLVDHLYRPADLKTDMESALRAHFGAAGVTRGNKVLVVRENTYRVSADVAPTFEVRRYAITNGRVAWHSGVILHPDRGAPIENWPQHHHDAGVAKNERTTRRFKAVVRILKRLRDEMEARLFYPPLGLSTPASLFIESLVWQVPNHYFGGPSYTADVYPALLFLGQALESSTTWNEWTEISGMKYLFRGRADWSQRDALAFVVACLQYTGMVRELASD